MELDFESFAYRDKKALEEIGEVLKKYRIGIMPILRTVDLDNPEGGIVTDGMMEVEHD